MPNPLLHPRQDQRGGALLLVIVVAAVLGIMAVEISRQMDLGLNANKSMSNKDELIGLRQTLAKSVDCHKTLGVSPPLTGALSCSTFAAGVQLRDRANRAIDRVGSWTISARCDGAELRIGASRPGKDPLTGQAYGTKAAATDLFAGMNQHFCAQFFDPTRGSYLKATFQQLANEIGGDFDGDGDAARAGCGGVRYSQHGGYLMRTKAACNRLCRTRDWAAGYLADCRTVGSGSNWMNHEAFCGCVKRE